MVADPAAAAAPASTGEADRYVAQRLLDTVREDIGRADSKAAVLLSGALALPALLLGGDRRPGGVDAVGVVLWSCTAVLWLFGVGCLVLVVLPRLGTARPGPGLTFFRDFLRSDGPDGLALRVSDAARDPVRWLVVQTVDVSTILAAKYRCIRWAVATLAPAAVLAACALVTG
ncbi:Pycsar system effector family protein [Kitasatospora sp. NPDC088346]|uniref:Pycsar system effector family protein n=1 Tax=Kitasatospora sp. NPDC088346 TaxID=3364073 RepID=UPI0037F3BDFB